MTGTLYHSQYLCDTLCAHMYCLPHSKTGHRSRIQRPRYFGRIGCCLPCCHQSLLWTPECVSDSPCRQHQAIAARSKDMERTYEHASPKSDLAATPVQLINAQSANAPLAAVDRINILVRLALPANRCFRLGNPELCVIDGYLRYWPFGIWSGTLLTLQ